MSDDAAHKSWWQIGEIVFGIPFLLSIAFHQVLPLSLPRGYFTLVFLSGGVVFIIAGVIIMTLARREFAQHGQPTDPGRPTTRIVSQGVYAISRNPLYLGAVCFLIGIDLVLNLPWGLILLLPSTAGCHFILIAPEERYLAARFGEEYRVYAAKVHRWIGHT